MSWSAVHVHYHQPQDNLLADGIAPAVVAARSHASRWFFLRYWERGPHIRLRFRYDDGNGEAALQSVRAALEAYIARHPSTSSLSPERLAAVLLGLARLEGTDGTAIPIADNTVVAWPYEPEGAKYGGPLGIDVAEELFERSSDAVIETLRAVRAGEASRPGIAFAMMLAAARAGSRNEIDSADFLATYCRFWSRYVGEDGRSAWGRSLAEKERALLPHAAEVLAGTTNDGSAGAAALERWRDAVGHALERLDAQAGRILPAVTIGAPWATAAERRDIVLLNYLHTHNNRLGVLPAQEAYLAYLAHHVVCRLAGVTEREDLITAPAAARE